VVKCRTRKPTLLEKIAQMLPGKRADSSIRTYRRIRARKKDKCKISSPSASSSSSTDEEDERKALLKVCDRQVCDRLQTRPQDSRDNIYNKDYDSHRARRRTICSQPVARAVCSNANLEYPHEKKFPTTQLPRYLNIQVTDRLESRANEYLICCCRLVSKGNRRSEYRK